MLCSKHSVQGSGVRSSSAGVGEVVRVGLEEMRVEALRETEERGEGKEADGVARRRSGNSFERGREDGGGIWAEDFGTEGGFIVARVCCCARARRWQMDERAGVCSSVERWEGEGDGDEGNRTIKWQVADLLRCRYTYDADAEDTHLLTNIDINKWRIDLSPDVPNS